ncbi:MAG: hypothetical protein M1823_003726 [Watsoniomyces obsoletus]|nr:MAG: hypothetical protein M1823_003726 [Watsoniomyces obsoletus]
METSQQKSPSFEPLDDSSVHSLHSTPDGLDKPTVGMSTDRDPIMNGHTMPVEQEAPSLVKQETLPSEHESVTARAYSYTPTVGGLMEEMHQRDVQQRHPDNASMNALEPNTSTATPAPMPAEGAERYTQVAVDSKTSKRIKVVSYQEYRNRHNGIRPTRTSKRRLPSELAYMPNNILGRIFGYCSPPTLARVARVNKLFHTYLLVPQRQQLESLPTGANQSDTLDPEPVWAASRQLHHPDMPGPISGWSEVAMWKLLTSDLCQFCSRTPTLIPNGELEYPGAFELGETGIAVFWAFGFRSCLACFLQHTEKELDLLISNAIPSPFLSALPFTFLTPKANLVTATALQIATPPATLTLTKYYNKSHIQDIKIRFEEAQRRGGSAPEEWLKSLTGEGQHRRGDAERWERWDYFGGRSRLRSMLRNVDKRPIIVMTDNRSLSFSGGRPGASTFGSPAPSTTTSPANQGAFHPPRVERTMHQVNELKAARRSEIERRCLELDPPISTNLLQHMESFQNALLISTPLTDSAWAVLKPRLLAQREMAERKEEEKVVQAKNLQAKYEQRRHLDAQMKEEKEIMEREWEEAQGPIRERLAQYAEEITKDKWEDGNAITNDTSPKYAADVLLYVRQRFYRHIADLDAAAEAAGQEIKHDAPDGPPTRRLILENMKWVFDTQIKKYTEQYRKELFLCHVCESSKYYGFEGVVQHFAAKHTNTLSQGSVVVHWRAEWPEYPPFHPDPSAAKSSFHHHHHPPPTSGGGMHGSMHSRYAQSPAPYRPPGHHRSSGYPQPSPGPYAYGHRDQPYAGQYHQGPFAPPPGYPPPHGFSGAPPPGFGPEPPMDYHEPPSVYHGSSRGYQASPPQYSSYRAPPSSAPHGYAPSYSAPAYPPATDVGRSGSYGYGAPRSSYPSQALPPSEIRPLSIPAAPGPSTGALYQEELEYVGSKAHDIYAGTSGIRDMGGNVRIYVIIHHVAMRFLERFGHDLSLALFADGLKNHPGMKQIRNISGLTCKTCQRGANGSGYPHSQYMPAGPMDAKRFYPIPMLLAHFQTLHLDRERTRSMGYYPNGAPLPRLDWKKDMVDLPEQATVANLLHAAGMDDYKLRLIADIFPSAFPWPLPVLGHATSVAVSSVPDSGSPRPMDGEAWRLTGREYNGSRGSSYLHAGRDGTPRQLRSSMSHASGRRSLSGRPDLARAAFAASGPPMQSQQPHQGLLAEGSNGHHPVTGKRARSEEDGQNGGEMTGHDRVKVLKSHHPAPAEDTQPVTLSLQVAVEEAVQPSPVVPPQKPVGKGTIDASEDGEVDGLGGAKQDRSKSIPAEALSAAERFLNEFGLGEDTEAYQPKTAEQDRLSDVGTKTEPTQAVEAKKTTGLPVGIKGLPPRPDFAMPVDAELANNHPHEMVADTAPPPMLAAGEPSLALKTQQSHPTVYRSDHYTFSQHHGPGSEQIVEAAPRYGSSTIMYHDERQRADAARRPRSRFERYETFRQGTARLRSRSPPRQVQPIMVEPITYRRDPVPADPRYEQYRSRSPIAVYRESHAVQHGRQYSGDPRMARYRSFAADDPRSYGTTTTTYRMPAEYVPVRAVSARSPPPGTILVQTPSRSGTTYEGYPSYADEYSSRPVYDARGTAVYRVDRTYQASDSSRRYPSQPPRY